jgi:hypothetical protein
MIYARTAAPALPPSPLQLWGRFRRMGGVDCGEGGENEYSNFNMNYHPMLNIPQTFCSHVLSTSTILQYILVCTI